MSPLSLPHAMTSAEDAKLQIEKSLVGNVEWKEIFSPLAEGTWITVMWPLEEPVKIKPSSLLLAIPQAYAGSGIDSEVNR